MGGTLWMGVTTIGVGSRLFDVIEKEEAEMVGGVVVVGFGVVVW